MTPRQEENVEQNELAKRLRRARLDVGLQRFDEAAKATGISVNTIKSYEYGKFVPNAFNLAALAKAYGVSTDWLLGLQPDPSGLPTGKALVDLDISEAILSAETREDILPHIQWSPSIALCIVEIPSRSRIVKLTEALTFGQKIVQRIQRLAPDIAEQWEEMERMLRETR